ncbi:hypothetical protein ACRB68_69120 [Actinomadura sp. RB68]|uniref:EfeO-type cupredoxin-like domain-containing protein n=2 Tax=Actinomadura macrotermitis TaxID=2585200 RepID=A0A7K0C5R8_9ACTN|nr:hypothetical protein [Actinomadura macrotermitis]
MLVTAVALGTLASAAACGKPADGPGGASGGATPAPAGSSGAPATGTAPAGQTGVTNVEATVTKGKVRTASGRVKVRLGARVRITVTSDTAEEFHLHGYDREMTLAPGKAATLELVADKPGVFEAELHHSGARVFELQVG